MYADNNTSRTACSAQELGLTVDDMAAPTELVVTEYPEPGRRHAEPFTIVARIKWNRGSDNAASLIEELGVPRGSAVALDVQLNAKLASWKAPLTKMGFRPVR